MARGAVGPRDIFGLFSKTFNWLASGAIDPRGAIGPRGIYGLDSKRLS